jgi:hypothetical protein
MAEDVQYQIDEGAQILIISPREEHSGSEGAILTAERNGPRTTGSRSSAEPHSDKIVICLTKTRTHLIPTSYVYPLQS